MHFSKMMIEKKLNTSINEEFKDDIPWRKNITKDYEPHYVCSVITKFILDLLDFGKNFNAEIFR